MFLLLEKPEIENANAHQKSQAVIRCDEVVFEGLSIYTQVSA